jgi:AcrR family transcriptional regulator
MARPEGAVLEGVGRCLVAQGARRTTMIDIAAAAGIAKGTLYNHVRTRAEAYTRYGEAQVDVLVETIAVGGLVAAAEAIAAHPVAARLRSDEPAALATVLLSVGSFRPQLLEALGDAVGEPAAPVAYRWLLSLLVEPGTSEERSASSVAVAGSGGVDRAAVAADR